MHALDDVLDRDQLRLARDLICSGRFESGKRSAGEMAVSGKHNLELEIAPDLRARLDNLVMGALVRHPVYLNAGLPRNVAAPYYVLYRQGMHYDYHVDDPVMGGQNRYRADMAITLFLNAPGDYAGGELEIRTTFGTRKFSGQAGGGVMYPASSRHRVTEVTRGERLVAVTWMQSLVPDAEKRDLLYQLYQASESLRRNAPDSEVTRQVHHSYCNLVRMWSIP